MIKKVMKSLDRITTPLQRVALLSLFCLFIFAAPGSAHATGGAFKSYDYVDGAGKATAQTDVQHGTVEVGDDFVCNDDGTTSGILFVNPNCDTGGILGIFSQVACRVENVFGTAMGLVYCSIYAAIMQPFVALLGLYVTIYGASVVLGLTRANFRAATKHVMKMALVAGFVLSSQTTIQVGYKFYVQMTQATAGILFESFDTVDDPAAGDESLQNMVRAGYLAGTGSETGRAQTVQSEYWMTHLDGTLNRIVNFFVEGGVGFIMVLLGLLIFIPPLFAVVVYLIYSCIKMLVQAIIGYLMAILGISFLFAMAPIFISFALFKVTYAYFENWLKYLATFTLQMFVIFTLLMFVVAVDLVGFFQQIGGLITSYKYVWSFGWVHVGFDVITLCRVERQGDPTGREGEIIYYRFALDGQESDDVGNRYDGFPRCIPDYTYEEVSTGARSLPGLNFADQEDLMDRLDEIRDNWEDEGLPEKPANSRATLQAMIDQENEKLAYPFMELAGTADIIAFLLVRFLAVAVLTFLLEHFAKEAPALAVRLAGSTTGHGRLGGGHDPRNLPSLQDDATFDMVRSDGGEVYKDYYKEHSTKTFALSRAARTDHLAANPQHGFMRRHFVANAKGTWAGAKSLGMNRVRRVAGVAPVMAHGAQTLVRRSLANQSHLGRKPDYDAAMGQAVRDYNRFGGDYYHAGKPLDDDGNLGRFGRHGKRGHRPGGHGGPRRHQRGS